MERVQKIIAQSGYCSRRKAEELIAKGLVFVNEEKIKLGDKADAAKDTIRIGGHTLKKEDKVYLMLNKPRGYITTSDDPYERKKVTDLVESVGVRVFPVGRLDRDASGLLLMTNDGEWANNIMHPRYNVEKEYLAELGSAITKEDLANMNKGVKLSDGFIRPKVKMINKNFCSVIVHEGKNKIVKRIFNEFNVRVVHLKRVRVGKYLLGNIKPGQWRNVNKDFNVYPPSKSQSKPRSK